MNRGKKRQPRIRTKSATRTSHAQGQLGRVNGRSLLSSRCIQRGISGIEHVGFFIAACLSPCIPVPGGEARRDSNGLESLLL